MTIAADIYSAIQSRFSGRLYPDVAPENQTKPFGVFQLVSGVPNTNLSGESNLMNYRFQIDCFATTRAAATALAVNVRTDMNSASTFKSICNLQQDLFESEVSLYRCLLDFSVWA